MRVTVWYAVVEPPGKGDAFAMLAPNELALTKDLKRWGIQTWGICSTNVLKEYHERGYTVNIESRSLNYANRRRTPLNR